MTDATSFQTNDLLKAFKGAFAPVTDALKSIQTVDVPEAARDFVKRAADAGKDRTADVHANAEKVTSAVESVAAKSVTETAKVSRTIQQAMVQDAEAFFAGLNQLANAKSLTEAFQIQTDYVKTRGDVAVTRAKATAEYVGKLMSQSATLAQDNVSEAVSAAKAA